MDKNITIAVTGLNATDNPGPGIAVVRALRNHPSFKGRIVGLAYDAMEPGVYARDFVDDVFLIPYPSQGVDALRNRLHYIHEKAKISALIPTLDAELPSFIELSPELQELGIGTFLPSRAQLELRSKAKLNALGARGLPVPDSEVVSSVGEMFALQDRFGYPFVVKGAYYGAHIARSADEAVYAFQRIAAEWGLPIIVQKHVMGEELCVLAVGDGEGGLIGAVQMRKTVITDKGKGWAGITIRDPGLENLSETFMRATRWRGPCELEVIRDREGKYHVLEVNPRLPAWCFLSAGAGMNLPYAVAELALGRSVTSMKEYTVGTMFVRIAIDQIATVATLSQISMHGEIAASAGVTL